MAHDCFKLYAAGFCDGLNARVSIERARRFDHGVQHFRETAKGSRGEECITRGTNQLRLSSKRNLPVERSSSSGAAGFHYGERHIVPMNGLADFG